MYICIRYPHKEEALGPWFPYSAVGFNTNSYHILQGVTTSTLLYKLLQTWA